MGNLILIAEDDADTARLNARMLRRKGYDVLIARNAEETRTLLRESAPDLFVLDIELPDGDGFALCEGIRRESDAPVLFLTGRKAMEDKVTGLHTGGDYYLTKPYAMEEFIAVTERLLRKAEDARDKLNRAVREAVEIRRGPLTLILPKNKALVNGRDAELTPKEFAVLLMLVKNEDREISGEEIYRGVWETTMNNDSTAIRKHISTIKKKLVEEDADDFSITNLYGGAYIFTTK